MTLEIESFSTSDWTYCDYIWFNVLEFDDGIKSPGNSYLP